MQHANYTTFAGKISTCQQKQCSSTFCTCALLLLGSRNFTSKSSVLRHFAHVHYFGWEVEICPAKVVYFVILHMYTTFAGKLNFTSKSSVVRHFAHVHYFGWDIEILPAKVVYFDILHMCTTFAGKSKFYQQKQCSSSFCTCTLLLLGSRNLSSKSSVVRHFAHVHYFGWEVEICPAKVVYFVILHMYTTFAGKSKFVQQKQCSSSFCTCTLLWLGSRNLSSKSSVVRHFAHVHYFGWEVEICPAKVVQFVILHMYTTLAGKSKFSSKSSVLRHFAHVHYFGWEVDEISKFYQQKQCTSSFCTCTLLLLGVVASQFIVNT